MRINYMKQHVLWNQDEQETGILEIDHDKNLVTIEIFRLSPCVSDVFPELYANQSAQIREFRALIDSYIAASKVSGFKNYKHEDHSQIKYRENSECFELTFRPLDKEDILALLIFFRSKMTPLI